MGIPPGTNWMLRILRHDKFRRTGYPFPVDEITPNNTLGITHHMKNVQESQSISKPRLPKRDK